VFKQGGMFLATGIEKLLIINFQTLPGKHLTQGVNFLLGLLQLFAQQLLFGFGQKASISKIVSGCKNSFRE
jgi:hypothetical protein